MQLYGQIWAEQSHVGDLLRGLALELTSKPQISPLPLTGCATLSMCLEVSELHASSS